MVSLRGDLGVGRVRLLGRSSTGSQKKHSFFFGFLGTNGGVHCTGGYLGGIRDEN